MTHNMWQKIDSNFCIKILNINSQVNITSENIATVINNLTSIISTANVTEDQNIGNVRTVQTVLAQTASLLQSPTMRGTIPQTVVEMVCEVE